MGDDFILYIGAGGILLFVFLFFKQQIDDSYRNARLIESSQINEAKNEVLAKDELLSDVMEKLEELTTDMSFQQESLRELEMKLDSEGISNVKEELIDTSEKVSNGFKHHLEELKEDCIGEVNGILEEAKQLIAEARAKLEEVKLVKPKKEEPIQEGQKESGLYGG